MIVKLTPDIKFVCDRCGREEYPDENGYMEIPRTVMFVEERFPSRNKNKEGQICKICNDEFWELANNFFDEVNKNET